MSNDTNKENIEKETALVHNVYKQTQAVIDGMPVEGDGSRMQIKDMAEAVAVTVGLESKEILHMVNRYAHNSIGGYVTRGKKGGYKKGVKPVKVAVVVPAVAVATDATVTE